jgi:hypothetical protein
MLPLAGKLSDSFGRQATTLTSPDSARERHPQRVNLEQAPSPAS